MPLKLVVSLAVQFVYHPFEFHQLILHSDNPHLQLNNGLQRNGGGINIQLPVLHDLIDVLLHGLNGPCETLK